jgi:hypothetical protein
VAQFDSAKAALAADPLIGNRAALLDQVRIAARARHYSRP